MAVLKYWDGAAWKALSGGDSGGGSLPAGGAAGTGLVKNSTADGDASWVDICTQAELVTEGFTRSSADTALDTRVDALESTTVAAGAGIVANTVGTVTTFSMAALSTVRGMSSTVAANNNNTVIANTATQTSMWFGTKYQIPAGTLQVGDTIEIYAPFTITNTAGGTTFNVRVTFGGATSVFAGTTITTNAQFRSAIFRYFGMFATVGGAGICYGSASLGIGDVNDLAVAAPVTQNRSNTLTGIVTTTDLEVDVLVTLGGGSATYTTTGRSIRILRHNAP